MRKKSKRFLALLLAFGLTVPSSTGLVEPVSMVSTVQAATKKLTLKASNKNVYVGSSAKLNVKATKGAKLSYKTSNKKIATIDNKGNIKGRKAGTAKITITAKKSKYKTVKKTITVKVVKQNQKITASNVSLYYKKGRYLGAKAKTGLTYKSSNSSVVSVNSKGYIVGKKVGTAKIYITAKESSVYKKTTKTVVVKVIKQASTPVVKPTATPKPTAKPTATPKPTTAPKPTATPMPTATPKPTATPTATPTPKPTETPVVEPSDMQKAEIDSLCSTGYKLPYTYINKKMCVASSFKFTTDASLVSKGNYCYVESSNSSLIKVHTEDGSTLLMSIASDALSSNIGKSVTVTFRMGSYSRSCTIILVSTSVDWSNVSEETIAKSIIDKTDYADEVIRLINEYRVSKGVEPLEYEERSCLKTSAVASGCAIINACKPDCISPADTLASHGSAQIGWGATGGGASNTPQEVVQDWINSPLHRSNILNSRRTTIACAFFICNYRDPVTDSLINYVSVKCTLGACKSSEIADVYANQDELDNNIISRIDNYVKSKEELDKYANWFFHPKGDVSFPSKTSTQSVGSNDFSVFSDGSETSMDSFASGESVGSVESAEPVTSESEVVGEPIEIEDSLESSTDSSEGFDDSVESIEIESEE